MNVLVLTTMIPFVETASDQLHKNLVQQLDLRGVSAETVRIPVVTGPTEYLIDQIVLCRSLQLSNVDRVVALSFPAYLVPHANKVCWFTDYWKKVDGAIKYGGLHIPNAERGRELVRLIQHSDNECLGQARNIFAGSLSIRRQLKAFSGLDSYVLTPPLHESTSGSTWDIAIERLLA